MIYRNEPPRSLRDLERLVKDLPRKTKFEVLEVNSTRDRLKTNLTFDRYLRKEPLPLSLSRETQSD